MKKTLSIIILTTLCIPNLVFASWWNPTTWFKKKNSVVQKQEEVISPPVAKVIAVQPVATVVTTTSEQASTATNSGVSDVKKIDSLPSCVSLTKDLIKGQSDPEVTLLQKFLGANGYLNGRPNGTIGEGTYIAIQKFQFENGLPQTGKIDNQSRKIIKEISCEGKIAKPINPFDTLFKNQNEIVIKATEEICTVSTPSRSSRALEIYSMDLDTRIASIESSLEELKNDSRFNQKMKDVFDATKKSHTTTKNCITKFDALISKPENATTFNSTSCNLVKTCMNDVLETSKSAQSFFFLLWDVFTPAEKNILMNSLNSQIQ